MVRRADDVRFRRTQARALPADGHRVPRCRSRHSLRLFLDRTEKSRTEQLTRLSSMPTSCKRKAKTSMRSSSWTAISISIPTTWAFASGSCTRSTRSPRIRCEKFAGDRGTLPGHVEPRSQPRGTGRAVPTWQSSLAHYDEALFRVLAVGDGRPQARPFVSAAAQEDATRRTSEARRSAARRSGLSHVGR